jgi:hypothetical protein
MQYRIAPNSYYAVNYGSVQMSRRCFPLKMFMSGNSKGRKPDYSSAHSTAVELLVVTSLAVGPANAKLEHFHTL